MNRVIELLKSTNRTGTENLIDYLQKSNYATARCYKHHKYRGGLVDHSLEIYELMKEQHRELADESLIICALCHDLGKSKHRGYTFSKDISHPRRSIAILDRCGFELTQQERAAILSHHHTPKTSLHICLTSSDMISTGRWKQANPDPRWSIADRIKNETMYQAGIALSKL